MKKLYFLSILLLKHNIFASFLFINEIDIPHFSLQSLSNPCPQEHLIGSQISNWPDSRVKFLFKRAIANNDRADFIKVQEILDDAKERPLTQQEKKTLLNIYVESLNKNIIFVFGKNNKIIIYNDKNKVGFDLIKKIMAFSSLLSREQQKAKCQRIQNILDALGTLSLGYKREYEYEKTELASVLLSSKGWQNLQLKDLQSSLVEDIEENNRLLRAQELCAYNLHVAHSSFGFLNESDFKPFLKWMKSE